MLRKLWIAFAALAGLFVVLRVLAEPITLQARAPTDNTDGSPLTDLVAINVYHKAGSDAFSLVESVAFTEPGGLFGYSDDRLDGVHCYFVTAVAADGDESAMSNEACKVIDTVLPSAITDLVAN